MSTTAVATEERGVGRPRDARLDAAIRAAAIELLIDGGYNQLSIEAIARRAGTTKRAIYRRWPSKAHLVHEVVFPDNVAVPSDTGDFRTDVRRMVTGALHSFGRPEARSAAPGLMAEFQSDPTLHDLLTARLERNARAAFRALIDAAVERGDARPGIDADLMFDMIAGTVLFAVQVSEGDKRGNLIDDVTDLVMRCVGP